MKSLRLFPVGAYGLLLGILAIIAGSYLRVAIPPRHAWRASTFAGCYSVSVGTWSMSHSTALSPPPAVELDSQRVLNLHGRIPRYALRPQLPVYEHEPWQASPEWAIWQDTVFVSWSQGFGGLMLRIRPERGALRGVAVITSDFIGPPEPSAPVILRRTECSGTVLSAGAT